MAKFEEVLAPGLTIRESANDGSDFTNPTADYRRLFLGEDGQLHAKDSAGTVTDIGASSGSVATDTIWDAAGDLAVGTGANTAAKLAIGAAGQIAHVASGTVAWGHPSGSIVQVVRAQSTADDSTTSTTYQASSLSGSITPKYSNSIIAIRVDGECQASRDLSTTTGRHMWVAIQNTTDAVTVVENVRGLILAATSTAAAGAYSPISLYGEYTVNSTSARTFQLQYKSTEATNVRAALNGSRAGGIRMRLEEIRA